jgi:hypothetical protein
MVVQRPIFDRPRVRQNRTNGRPTYIAETYRNSDHPFQPADIRRNEVRSQIRSTVWSVIHKHTHCFVESKINLRLAHPPSPKRP